MPQNYKKPPFLKGLDLSTEDIEGCIRNNSLSRLSIELSRNCNLKCPYCYLNENKEKIEDELSFEDIKKIIRQAKQAGAKTITLVGGEPTIYPRLRELVSFINAEGLTPLIFTNGTVMTEELAGFLYENNASIIVKFNSWDAPEIQNEMVGNIEGVFEKIQKTISLLIKAGFNKEAPTRLGVESVISRANLSQIPKIFKFARENNIFPYLELITPAGKGKDNEEILTKEEAKNVFYDLLRIDEEEFGYTWIPRPPQVATTCKYYFSSIYVCSHGQVQPCPGNNIDLGNLKKESLSEVLDKPNTKKHRNVRNNIKGKCRDCHHRLECYGCRGAVYNLTGDPFEEYSLCWIPDQYPPLKQIRIEVTQKCNQNCKYCYVEHITKKEDKEELTFEEIKDIITETMGQGLETVSLTGGETFLKYELAKKVFEFSSKNNLKTGLLTNGTLANKKQLRELKEMGLDWIRVSLDGTTKEINAACRDDNNFENIINTIKWSKEVGLYTIIRTTASNRNKHDLKKMMHFALELGVDRLDIQPFFPTTNEEIDKKFFFNTQDHKEICGKLLEYRRELQDKPMKIILYHDWFEFILPEYKGEEVAMATCGRSFCFIDSFGNVKTCGPNSQILGDVRQDNILNTWNNSKALRQHRQNIPYGVCKECDKFHLCLNSCPAPTYNLYKSLEHPPAMCPKVRESEDGYYS